MNEKTTSTKIHLHIFLLRDLSVYAINIKCKSVSEVEREITFVLSGKTVSQKMQS